MMRRSVLTACSHGSHVVLIWTCARRLSSMCIPNQYGGNHPCVITAQTLTDAYDAACETYKILTGEQP